jgi:hypothetical protein
MKPGKLLHSSGYYGKIATTGYGIMRRNLDNNSALKRGRCGMIGRLYSVCIQLETDRSSSIFGLGRLLRKGYLNVM